LRIVTTIASPSSARPASHAFSYGSATVERSQKLGDGIEDAESDWHAKQQDDAVPGASGEEQSEETSEEQPE
jgi:hypothetical protein